MRNEQAHGGETTIQVSIFDTIPTLSESESWTIRERVLIDRDTLTDSGTPFNHHEETAASLKTPMGVILVDFSNFRKRYPNGGAKGEVYLQGEALTSNGHKGGKDKPESLAGVRKVHTGNESHGMELLGPNEFGLMQTLIVRVN